MKKNVVRSVKQISLILLLLFVGYSCSDDDPIIDYEETQWNIENFTVNASDWSWNPTQSRWEAVKQLKFIDEFIYENGAVIGYIFFSENGKEVQYQLPHTVNIVISGEETTETLTETLDYYFDFISSRVTFLIKPSDSIEDTEAKQTYNFRIAMIW